MKEKISPLFGSMALRKLKQRLGRFIIPRLPVNRHVFRHIRIEINALWVRLNNMLNPFYVAKRIKIAGRDNLSVNVGCGPFGKNGWINLDLISAKNITLRYDCRKGLPLKENSCLRIRCEHFLEHIDFKDEVPLFLKSCFNALKINGVLRIAVPDAEAYLLAYQARSQAEWVRLGWDLKNLPEDFISPMDVINFVFHQECEHAYAYDFETLEIILQRAGFQKIARAAFGVSVDPELRDDLANHKPDSLYVEAVK